MYKKDLDEIKFLDYIDSEIIAFYCYDEIVRNKKEHEYVDAIANSYCGYSGEISEHIPTLYNAKKILENDYNIDIYNLPFQENYHKSEIKRYELMNMLEDYLLEKNIEFEKEEIYLKGKLLAEDDIYARNIIAELDDIEINIKVQKKINI